MVTGSAGAEGDRRRGARPLVIGLVGGIGSGKSLVARLIAERGGVVIDADRLGHELLREPEVKERVRALWGEGVFDEAGEVDRRRLARAVFSAEGGSPGIQALNRIVHPELIRRVTEAVERARRQGRCRWVVVDAALLLEWGLERLCDVVVFVEAPPEVRRRRLSSARGWSAEEVARREASQLPLGEKRARAQRVLVNVGSPEALSREVDELLAAVEGSIETRRRGG